MFDGATREKDVKLYDIGVSVTRIEGTPTIAVELMTSDATEKLVDEYGQEYNKIHDEFVYDMQIMIENLANNLMNLEKTTSIEKERKQ